MQATKISSSAAGIKSQSKHMQIDLLSAMSGSNNSNDISVVDPASKLALDPASKLALSTKMTTAASIIILLACVAQLLTTLA